MTTEQVTYIRVWLIRNSFVKEEKWLEGKAEFSSEDVDKLWIVDEDSYQIKNISYTISMRKAFLTKTAYSLLKLVLFALILTNYVR